MDINKITFHVFDDTNVNFFFIFISQAEHNLEKNCSLKDIKKICNIVGGDLIKLHFKINPQSQYYDINNLVYILMKTDL